MQTTLTLAALPKRFIDARRDPAPVLDALRESEKATRQ